MRAETTDGLCVDRDDFPSECELAERLDVSVITTRAALDRLAAEGWIVRRLRPARGQRPVAV